MLACKGIFATKTKGLPFIFLKQKSKIGGFQNEKESLLQTQSLQSSKSRSRKRRTGTISKNNFMQEKLGEIKWLSGKGFTEDQVDDILNDLKPAFEDSYFNKSDDEYPYDDWYDDFSEERIRPYLEARVEKLPDMPIENVGSAPDYAELVRDSVRKEFEAFKENVMSQSAEDIFYHNYEIHVIGAMATRNRCSVSSQQAAYSDRTSQTIITRLRQSRRYAICPPNRLIRPLRLKVQAETERDEGALSRRLSESNERPSR